MRTNTGKETGRKTHLLATDGPKATFEALADWLTEQAERARTGHVLWRGLVVVPQKSLADRLAGRLARRSALRLGLHVATLHEVVLTIPDVIRAIRAGELRVRRQAPPAKPKTKTRRPTRRSGRKKTR